jgi:hypothetical protein
MISRVEWNFNALAAAKRCEQGTGMDPIPPAKSANCPDCGAAIVPGAKKCWLCALKAESAVQPARDATSTTRDAPIPLNPYASPAPPSDHLSRTFSLSSMFLWTTLVAVVMGVATFAPGLAIALAILSLPAAVRTIGAVYRRKQRLGQPIPTFEKIETFLGSLSIVLAIIIGAGIAFTAVCFPIGLAGFDAAERGNSSLMIFGLVAGIVSAIVVAFFLGRRLWRLGD